MFRFFYSFCGIGWIARSEIPAFEKFTNEPKAKRARRHQKYAKETPEAMAIKEEVEKKNISSGSRSEREISSIGLHDRLNNAIQTEKKKKSMGTKKLKKATKINKIRNGRVTKK